MYEGDPLFVSKKEKEKKSNLCTTVVTIFDVSLAGPCTIFLLQLNWFQFVSKKTQYLTLRRLHELLFLWHW
jgi:hypothetical protein